MSLAEELLADLEDYDDDADDVLMNGAGQATSADAHDDLEAALDAVAATGGAIDEVCEDDELEEGRSGGLGAKRPGACSGIAASSYERVDDVARLRNSDHFKDTMQKIIEELDKDATMNVDGKAKHDTPTPALGTEHDPEYQLIVQANNLAVEIDNELNVIHKFIRDKYSKRFPELESLVPMPLEYIACVRELGNDILEKSKNSEQMQKILLPATVIVVSVTASTTQGQTLTQQELEVVEEACDMTEEINDAKYHIYRFVESRMTKVAPNLCQVVGPSTAAKLMGVAGGLKQLAKMPACNVQVLGAQKSTLSGFSSTAVLPHTGFIYYTPLIQSLPPDLRKKAARQMAGKCTLAARIDIGHQSLNGAEGRRLAQEVSQKFEKWQEPPPIKLVKALPKPLDQASKKRGGRRIRKMKERLGLTEMRKKANRMTFGDIQEDVFQDNMGVSLGHMKQGSTTPGGRIRAAQVDQKSRARMSQKLQRSLQRQNAIASAVVGGGATATSSTAGGSTTVSSKKHLAAGTASTVSFTPAQGLEISNPYALQDKKAAADAANAKYFGASTSFFKIATPTSVTKNSLSKGIISSLKGIKE